MNPILTLNTGNDGRDYDAFLRDKVAFDRSFGFDVDDADLSPIFRAGHPLYQPHQADVVKWAVAGGRRAIFARYGMGKSVMQLEVLRLIIERVGGRGLVVAPLGVRFDIVRDGRDLLDVEVRFVRTTAEVDPAWSGLYVTNYESVRDGKLDVDLFTAVSLDEAAVLRSFGSETYQRFLPLFADVPFRFVATATPSPNRHKELIHYAGFLGIMDTGAALTRFFQRDSSKAGNLTLYPHKRREFWLWLNTWACFLQRPSDLGYSDAGYALPELRVHWDEVQVGILSDQVERDGQGVLVRGGAMSLVDAAREKRRTLDARVDRAMQVVHRHTGDQILLWCDLNDEQTALERALTAEGRTWSSVHGGLTDDQIEQQLGAWLAGETYALIGKPVQLGRGLNLQQCSTALFVGITHKYEQVVQAVHRIHRFGQTQECDVHLIMGVERQAHTGEDCRGGHGPRRRSRSARSSNAHFWWQMDYLTPSLYRALMPGRILAVHVKDRQLFGSVTGAGVYTVSELHAEAIAHYRQHGFDYYGAITVTTDVVRENNQTYRLAYSKMLRDHSPMGVGSPEYVLLFHKPQSDRSKGWGDVRVVKDRAQYSVGRWQIDAAADWRASGDRLLSLDEIAALSPGARTKLFTEQSLRSVYDHEQHVALAERMLAANALPGTFAALVPGSPAPNVWHDILRIETLNGEQKRRAVENHICPFPLDIPRRLIRTYSNPGDLVYDPFSGLGSTVLEAVRQGRRGYGSELNPASVADSLVYLERHDREQGVPTLFDLLNQEWSAA